MQNDDTACKQELRRKQVRRRDSNGIDYIEVSEDQRQLTVYFLNKAPKDIQPASVVIRGGRRVRDIQVVDLGLCIHDDPERDDCLKIWVDRPGDYSTYTLCLEALDEHGRPNGKPLAGIDPRYSCLDFSFKVACPSDLDCKTSQTCPPEARLEPEINYLARDYASFLQLIYDRLALLAPDWKERHAPDLGVTLAELLAYAGDYLSYYQDAVATEAYLDTARRRISLRRHARLVDYRMHEGCNARTWAWFEVRSEQIDLNLGEAALITYFSGGPPTGTVLSTAELEELPPDSYLAFEPVSRGAVRFYEAHNSIRFYTWGDRQCCLPTGSTRASLLDAWRQPEVPPDPAPDPLPEPPPDPIEKQQAQAPAGKGGERKLQGKMERALNLHPGDVLIFEEVIGARTGNPADADPRHRHAVRLTSVTQVVDELYPSEEYEFLPTPLVEIEWEPADALPFPLCISATGPAPECALLEDISIAHANVLPVDHGWTEEPEFLGVVPVKAIMEPCDDTGCPPEVIMEAGVFRPALQQAAGAAGRTLTFSAPWEAGPAVSFLDQDPRRAVPEILLYSIPGMPSSGQPLFTLQDVRQPGDLAQRLSAASDPASQYLKGLLSLQTLQLMEQQAQIAEEGEVKGGQAKLTADLSRSLQHDLENLLEQWEPRYDLLDSGPDDRHFVVEMDEEGSGAHLRFGDGYLGRQPDAGAGFYAVYRTGNGPSGNLGAGSLGYLLLRQTAFPGAYIAAHQPLPACCGQAPEAMVDVRQYAPYAFRQQLVRAVTADDYAQLAGELPGVQRAAAELRWNGSWYEIRTAVDALGMQTPEAGLLSAVEAELMRYRRIGHDLVVLPAQQAPLLVGLEVCVAEGYLRGHVRAALLERFGSQRTSSGEPGFFHPDNLTFGEGVFASRLVALAMETPGVESARLVRLERLFEGPNGELENGLLPLGALEVARLDNDPGFPENGMLKLILRGGR